MTSLLVVVANVFWRAICLTRSAEVCFILRKWSSLCHEMSSFMKIYFLLLLFKLLYLDTPMESDDFSSQVFLEDMRTDEIMYEVDIDLQ